MDTKELEVQRVALLETMRTAFPKGEYEAVLEAFEALGEPRTIRSGIRVEAYSLAARVKAAQGDKGGARQLLKQVWNAPLKNHRLCRHAAITALELGEYKHALTLIERAVTLVDQAKEEAPQQ